MAYTYFFYMETMINTENNLHEVTLGYHTKLMARIQRAALSIQEGIEQVLIFKNFL